MYWDGEVYEPISIGLVGNRFGSFPFSNPHSLPIGFDRDCDRIYLGKCDRIFMGSLGAIGCFDRFDPPNPLEKGELELD